jgi:hypothetical protein
MVMAAMGALLVSSGIALMAAPTAATAGPGAALESQCVPRAAYDDPPTGWLDEAPVGDYVVVGTRVIEIEPAGWQHYSWTGGPLDESSPAPAFPGAAGDWQKNTKSDPHKIGHAGAYFSSEQGKGNWFYLEAIDAVTATQHTYALHHPAVTCEAYADVHWTEPSCGTLADFETASGDPVDVTWSDPSAAPGPGVTVTLTATATDGYTFGGSAPKAFTHKYAEVVPPTGQTYDPVTGVCATGQPPVVEPPTVTPPVVEPPVQQVPQPKAAEPKTVVPTVVEAGLGEGMTRSSESGLGLVLVGALVLAGAATLVRQGSRR